LLFCYIDSNDCFGTLVEVGYAFAQNVPVVIAFAPSIASAVRNDFWFACVKARWVIYDAPEQALPMYLNRAIWRYL
jgi:nucleoside 2-deoxyribosyltransferase